MLCELPLNIPINRYQEFFSFFFSFFFCAVKPRRILSEVLCFHKKSPPQLAVIPCNSLKITEAGLTLQVESVALFLRLALHKVLVEVDAKQRADDLASSHPPCEESKEASEKKRSEDRA